MLLGIDTGGTFTDAVLFDDAADKELAVVAKAKARTRHHDLTLGIAESLQAVVRDPAEVSMVSLSTTLATNALVEGISARVGLVLLGFSAEDAERSGLAEVMDGDPIILATGGHDSFGAPMAEPDIEDIVRQAREAGTQSFAVTGQFAVRNPTHEIAVRDALIASGFSVTCSHELTARLNGPKRALTCVLNARLIGVISNLCDATESILASVGISAPLMIVRGDGSLVTAAFARSRPIETILSGPAASLIGASWLTETADAIVSDIGGTTTDIAILTGGEPALNPAGAIVGGHQTMVEAIQMYTHGLGGDSEVAVNDRVLPAQITLGPRRLTPLSVLAQEEPTLVHLHLDARSYPPRDTDCRFYRASGAFDIPEDLPERERALLHRLGDGWVAADKLVSGHLHSRAVQALRRRGLVRTAGFTPTDAALVQGLHDTGDREAAHKAAEFLALTSDSRGTSVHPDAASFSQWIVDSVIRRSAELVLDATFHEDGLTADALLPLVQRALDGHSGTARVDIGVDVPVVALGASAGTYYPTVARILGTEAIVPTHADVANALGAVVGQIRVVRSVTVSQPTKGQFRVHHPVFEHDFGSAERARDHAIEQLDLDVTAEAERAGAGAVTTQSSWEARVAIVEGREVFVEATATVIGTGRPRLALREQN